MLSEKSKFSLSLKARGTDLQKFNLRLDVCQNVVDVQWEQQRAENSALWDTQRVNLVNEYITASTTFDITAPKSSGNPLLFAIYCIKGTDISC